MAKLAEILDEQCPPRHNHSNQCRQSVDGPWLIHSSLREWITVPIGDVSFTPLSLLSGHGDSPTKLLIVDEDVGQADKETHCLNTGRHDQHSAVAHLFSAVLHNTVDNFHLEQVSEGLLTRL